MGTKTAKGLDGLKAGVKLFKDTLIKTVAIKLAGDLLDGKGEAGGRFEWKLFERPEGGVDAKIEFDRDITKQMAKDYFDGKPITVPLKLTLTLKYNQKMKKRD